MPDNTGSDHHASDQSSVPSNHSPGESIPLLDIAEDNCPNCGTLLPDRTSIVCTQCGYDLQKVAIRETQVQPSEPAHAESTVSSSTSNTPPLLRWPSVWKVMLAGSAAAALIMVGAFIAGWPGLFASVDGRFADAGGHFTAEAPSAMLRLSGLSRYLLFRLVLIASAVMALYVESHLRGRSPGPVHAVAAAASLVVLASGLISLIDLNNQAIERFLEIVGEVSLGLLGLIGLFRLKPSEALMTIGLAMMVIALAVLAAHVIVWAV